MAADGDDGTAARRRAQATSFGAAATAYERGRPPYPAAALDWLLPPGARRVLDLGAGTGKLTRQLRGRGLDVVAVEPLAGMREELSRSVPGTAVHDGSAEDIPLPDGSVDAVLVAQAWHWMDPGRAVPEVARVLIPHGRLGLVWNLRDERVPWVAELGRILNPDRQDGDHPQGTIGAPFGPAQRQEFGWRHRLTVDQLTDLAASRSYVITMPAARRAALLAAVRDLGRAQLARSGTAGLVMPYLTECFRADLS